MPEGRELAEPDGSPAIGEFRRALTREIMRTEMLRIKAVIATVSLLMAALALLWLLVPAALARISQGRFDLVPLFAAYLPFIAFEFWVLHVIGRRLAQQRDLAVVRRYLGALIETSLPSFALYLHMDWMGPAQALGFVAPLGYFLFIVLSTLRLDFWLSTFTGLVAASELFALAMLHHPAGFADEVPLDVGYHLVRSAMFLVGGVLAGAVGVQLRRQFEASIAAAGARDRVTNLFGQHVSPQVVERLLTQGAGAAGETRRVVVMFVDFRNFTGQAQMRSPQQVVARLDDAFAVLVDILDRHSGLGDGFLALFGAPIEDPEPARCAVSAAREMLAAMAEHNVGHDWPLRIGIGIHIGSVVVGNVGSPRRKEYTVIGDTVNFASRLESLNKEFGSQLLISAAIRDALGEDGADAELLGNVAVRGYEAPMAVWRLG